MRKSRLRGGIFVLLLPVPLGACLQDLPPPRQAGGDPEVAPAGPVRPATTAHPSKPQSPVSEPRVLETTVGQATYYSDRLAGRSTASGEPYDPRRLTAAHRTLPFGSRVRVVRTDKNLQVIVVINDRGPFAGKERIIDVSKSAAEQLDMLRAGVVPVRVEVLSYGDK